jgi:hypothetical protein
MSLSIESSAFNNPCGAFMAVPCWVVAAALGASYFCVCASVCCVGSAAFAAFVFLFALGCTVSIVAAFKVLCELQLRYIAFCVMV